MKNYLYQRRKQLALTQKEIAKAIGVSEATVSRYEDGNIANMKRDKIAAYAKILRTTPDFIMNGVPENSERNNDNIMRPVVGKIPAGLPVLAEQNIIGYESVDVSDPESTFWLIVRGDSMVGAGIQNGDKVLIRQQTTAENGQIVACRLNGNEATLKRFRRQGDAILLMPENPAYEPKIVPLSEFECGDAAIIGVAIQIKRDIR